jgi:hypothetical protein
VVTDGAFAPDGRSFVLRDYQAGYVYTAPGRRVGELPLPPQYQGESLTVAADGRSVLVGSEGPASEVWRVPLPTSILARTTPTTRRQAASPVPTGRPAAAGGGPGRMPLALTSAAGALVIVVAVLARRRRR